MKPAPFVRARVSTIVLSALASAACAPGEGAARVERTAAPVVYGDDDRLDLYAHPSGALQELGQRSIVALVRPADLETRDPSNVTPVGDDLQREKGLCDDQRFLHDPTAAYCSGTLIDDDLVLTAGHCIESETECRRTIMLFGYYRDASDRLHTMTQSDVFRCRRIVSRRLGATSESNFDYGVIQLDRPATPRFQPAVVRRGTLAIGRGTPVAVLGFGSGIPLKIDSGGVVRDPRATSLDYFLATTDTFGGNSGSGVFDVGSNELVGILVRGETDYVRRGSCSVVNSCAATACSGESVTYVHQALDALCMTEGVHSARLCGSAPVCGDGRCEPGETEAACAMDCAAPRCGDGRCNGDETSADCETDCGPRVPAGWTCRSTWYNVGDDCDCNCGVRDPDCDNPALGVLRCQPGQTCDSAGRCAGTPTPADAGVRDGGVRDGGPSDGAVGDGGPSDAAMSETSVGDAGAGDTGSARDAGIDAGASEAGLARDAGGGDAGGYDRGALDASGGCSCRAGGVRTTGSGHGALAFAGLCLGAAALERRRRARG